MDLVAKYDDLKKRISECNNNILKIKGKKESEEILRRSILEKHNVSSLDELKSIYNKIESELQIKVNELSNELDNKENLLKELNVYGN